MLNDKHYRKAFFIALGLHFALALMLLLEAKHQRPVMSIAKASNLNPVPTEAPVKEIVKAVSIDKDEIAKTVNRLKEEEAAKHQAELARQQALEQQARRAREARLKEQQELQKLKEEAEKVAIARKKQIEEEKQHLKQLALEKEKEAKRLQALKEAQEQLKKKQAQEALELAKLKQQQAQEKLKADRERAAKEKEVQRAEQEKAEKARLLQEKKELAQRQQAQALREKAEAQQAYLAGEVNKYKALIVAAISRQWILPEHINPGLSSQFRIRLAPDGAVLAVSLMRSSGDPILDRSAQTAIYKASPLPVPTDPTAFNLFRDISLTVRPENVRG